METSQAHGEAESVVNEAGTSEAESVARFAQSFQVGDRSIEDVRPFITREAHI